MEPLTAIGRERKDHHLSSAKCKSAPITPRRIDCDVTSPPSRQEERLVFGLVRSGNGAVQYLCLLPTPS